MKVLRYIFKQIFSNSFIFRGEYVK